MISQHKDESHASQGDKAESDQTRTRHKNGNDCGESNLMTVSSMIVEFDNATQYHTDTRNNTNGSYHGDNTCQRAQHVIKNIPIGGTTLRQGEYAVYAAKKPNTAKTIYSLSFHSSKNPVI